MLLHIQMHIGHLLQRAVEEELAPYGLHHGQGRMLNIIRRRAPLTQAELAYLMDVKAATVTNMLKPLELQGYVVRDIDPVTNRALLVSLTAEGATACETIRAAWNRVEQRMQTELDEQDLDNAFPLLEKIHAALGGTDPRTIDEALNNRRTS